MKKLYTIKITFSDFTFAVKQYETDSPEEAVELFFQNAECFDNYDREKLIEIMKKRLKEKSAVIQVKNGLRGVWEINTGTEFLDFEGDLEAIYGGLVIQTDPHGPRWS